MTRATKKNAKTIHGSKQSSLTPSAVSIQIPLLIDKTVDTESLKLSPQQFEQVKSIVLLTMQQTTALFNVTPQYIYKKIAEGKFPAPVKLGRMTRFRLVDLELYLESSMAEQ